MFQAILSGSLCGKIPCNSLMFCSPGALGDDQSSTQTKTGRFSASTSQKPESMTQQHPAGIPNDTLNCKRFKDSFHFQRNKQQYTPKPGKAIS